MSLEPSLTTQLTETASNSDEDISHAAVMPTRFPARATSVQPTASFLVSPWRSRVLPMAILLGALPALTIGTGTYWVGTKVLRQQHNRLNQTAQFTPAQSRSLQYPAERFLAMLLLGTSLLAILTGGMAWWWLQRLVNSIDINSHRAIQDRSQSLLTQSLGGVGRITHLLEQSTHQAHTLAILATQTQLILHSDRALVAQVSPDGSLTLEAEAVAVDQPKLRDLGDPHPVVAYPDLFTVPQGYVQVCCQVADSDLPRDHQTILQELGVQAQMITHLPQNSELDQMLPERLLIVQQAQPREWDDGEVQLMSALARQTALRLEQHQRETFHPQVSAAGIALSRRQQELALLWQEHQQTCQTLTQDATAQIVQVETAIAQLETNINRVQMLNATLHQTQGQVEQSHHLLEESQATIGQAMTTMTEIQETMVTAGVGARQLDEFCQKIEEISIQLKSLTDQINYQAMNATIESGRQSEGADWSPAFSNQIVQLTRQVRRCTNTLESLSADITTEAQSLANIADTASEQVLVGAEWFKDTRQKLGQLTAINAKMESLAERMTDNSNEQLQSTNDTHHTLFEIANLANATVAQASEMVQAMTQYNQAG
jgi:hypothetical protein